MVEIDTLLTILLPALSTLMAGLAWIIRGVYEKRTNSRILHMEKKKQHVLDYLNEQLKSFYLPMHFKLAKFKNIYDLYIKIKNINICDTQTNIDNNSNYGFIDEQELTMQKQIQHTVIDISTDNEFYLKNSTTSTPSEAEDNVKQTNKFIDMSASITSAIPPPTICLNGNKISWNNNNSSILDMYEDHMMILLLDIIETIEEKSICANVDRKLFEGLMKMCVFINITNIMYTKKKSDNSNISIDFVTNFPQNIYEMIEKRLYYIQTTYNDIISNRNSAVLKSKNLPNTERNLEYEQYSVYKFIRSSQKEKTK
jgi:hypothetical protein